jgi:hypothetical protein
MQSAVPVNEEKAGTNLSEPSSRREDKIQELASEQHNNTSHQRLFLVLKTSDANPDVGDFKGNEQCIGKPF